MKGTVLCDVYISMFFDISPCPLSSSTDKSNANNNKIKELGIIALDPINVYLNTT